MTLETITILAFVVLTAQIAVQYRLWYARHVVPRMIPLWIATGLAGLLTCLLQFTWLYIATLIAAALTALAGVRLAYAALPEHSRNTSPGEADTDTSGFE